MMRAAIAAALLALAACEASEQKMPPPETEGQKQRAVVDAATKVFTDCVLEAARTSPTEGGVGPLVTKAVEACPDERAALKAEVVKFTKLGRPTATDAQADALAEGSVRQLEMALRDEAAKLVLDAKVPMPATAPAAPAAPVAGAEGK